MSEATVSRVLNGVGPIKEETRKRVLEAARQLNYVPSALARNFATNRSGNLGVILPFVPKVHLFSAYYFSEILSGIGSKAREFGYDLLLLFQPPEGRLSYSELFHARKIDGCLILGATNAEEEAVAFRELQREGRPFCLINQHFAGDTFSEVDADHLTGSYDAVMHLIAQGCRQVAFINGPLHYSNSRDRLLGYRKAMAAAGLEVQDGWLFSGNYSRSSGYELAGEFAGMLDKIDAVFCANDRMAVGLIQGLRERGIPEQRLPAVVGYDDSDVAGAAMPPLTSVRVPFFEMGELAAAKVLRQIDGKMNEAANEHTNEHANEQLNEQASQLTNELTNEDTAGKAKQQANERASELGTGNNSFRTVMPAELMVRASSLFKPSTG